MSENNYNEEKKEITVGDAMSELEQEELDNEAEMMEGNQNAECENNPKKGMGVVAMILGIFAVLLFCIPIVGQILALAALIFGIAAAAKNKGKKMGISGIIMGAISLIAALVMILGFGEILNPSNVDKDILANAAWRRMDDGSVLYLYEDGTFIHVDEEGVFTDNFYSGTYVILPYDDTNLSFTGIESQYDTDYAYDVYLYVNQYVSNGQESENIVGTIRYLYMFDKKYSDGDAVSMCAHDSASYGDITPALETELMKPTIGNCYEPTEQAADTSEVEEETGDTTETVSEAITESATETNTEATSTEQATEENQPTEPADATEEVTEEGTEGIVIEFEEASSAMDEAQEEASSAFDEAKEEASSAFDEAKEEASSAFEEVQEEASSAAEEINDLVEDISDDTDVNQFVQFIRNLWQKVLDIFSNLGF